MPWKSESGNSNKILIPLFLEVNITSSLSFVQLFGCKVEEMEYKTLRNRDFKEYTLQVLMYIVVIHMALSPICTVNACGI